MDGRFETLAAQADELRREHSIPGLALGMVIDGQDHIATFGVTSVDNPLEVTRDTLFQVGSTTKTITTTALMCLVEGGQLSLDDRVRDHIPELRLQDEAVAETLTVRRLLNHTAGFAGDLFTATGNGDDALARYVGEMADLVQLIPPGEIAVYNNAAFGLASRVIEKATGETYETATRRLVLEPLKLDDSMFEPARAMLRRFAVGHIVHPDGHVTMASPWELSRAAAGLGGLASTVDDQLAYARFHMGDGSPILGRESMELMQTPTSKFNGDAEIGLSWILSEVNGTGVVAHGGQTNGQLSAFWFCPDAGIAFTSLTNASAGRRVNQELTDLACELFLGSRPTRPEAIEIDNAGEYEGRYRGEPNQDLFEVIPESGDLVFRELDAGRLAELFDRPDQATPSIVRFTGPDGFRLDGGDNHGSLGEFWRGDNGQVTHMRTSRLLIKER